MKLGEVPGWFIRAGASIQLGCSVVAVEPNQYGHRLQFITQSTVQTVQTNFFIDASGRGRHGWQRHSSRKQFDQMIGVSLLARMPGLESAGYSLIEAVRDGWFYSAQVSRNEVIACYMTDADLYSRGKIRNPDQFRAQLAASLVPVHLAE